MAQARLLLLLSFALSGLGVGCADMHGLSSDDAGGAYPDSTHSRTDAPMPGCPADSGVACDAGVPPPTDAASFGCGDSICDAGPVPISCTAQDARQLVCPAGVCDGLDSWAWDGERCVRIDCGTCVGADCGHLVHSPAACAANHATCVPTLCRASGGEWQFWAEECEHYHCGQRSPANCIVGMPVCDCGAGRSFDATRGGCFTDSSCPAVLLPPPPVLCTNTGGTWSRGICCPTRCGQHCAAACVADACTCGDLQVFDPQRGCVDDAACHVHTTGEICSAQIRCADGLLCCRRCSGVGCDPVTRCQAPVCSADPHIDHCGNNSLSP